MAYRKDLRLRTIAALKAAKRFRQDCLHDSKKLPVEPADLPACVVHTLTSSEEGQNPFMTDLDFTASVMLSIELAMDGISDGQLMADLDDIAELTVDDLLCEPTWLAGLQGIESVITTITQDDSTEHRTIIARIEIAVVVRNIYKPRVTDDFTSVDIKVDMIDPAADPNIRYPGPDGRIEARMLINNLPPPDPAN